MITRRDLLDWLGKAVVIGLGSELITACANISEKSERCYRGADEKIISFAPGGGKDPIYCDWAENTVDAQDLAKILREWKLTVDGLVTGSRIFTFFDLLNLPRLNQTADFHCVEGWSVLDVPWNGVHLSTIFNIVNPLSSATHITLHCVDDRYGESIPIEVAKEQMTMMAFGVDGSTLPLGHGFPLRLVVPRKYAYKSAKYVYRIELADRPETGYWENFGYSYDADVSAQKLRPGIH